MTQDEKRLFNKRAERLEEYRVRITTLEAELAEMKQKWITSEKWRKAYQNGKRYLYAFGGQVTEVAMAYLPCNESEVDRWFRKEYVHRDALDNANKELATERARLDWCAEHGCMAVEYWQGGYRVVNQHRVWMTESYDTPRAAIEAAMKGAQ